MSERGNPVYRALDKGLGPLLLKMAVYARRGFSAGNRELPASPRIGLLCLGAIGDLILCSAIGPALRMRFPGAEIQLFASRANAAAATLFPAYSRVHRLSVENPFAMLTALRAERLDLLIDCGQWARISALVAAFSGASTIVGFRTADQSRHYAFDISVEHRPDVHELENFRALAAAVGADDFSPPIIEPDSAAAKKLVAQLGLPERFVIFHAWPSGQQSHLKRWPEEHWAHLHVWAVEQGLAACLTGGAGDVEATRRLARMLAGNGPVRNLAGELNLEQTAQLLAASACVVTVNTGVLHLACALRAPVVALNGPTNPLRWGAWSSNSINLSPARRPHSYLNLGFEYPSGAPYTLDSLLPEAVIAAVEQATAARSLR